jgi:hypothetical protein
MLVTGDFDENGIGFKRGEVSRPDLPSLRVFGLMPKLDDMSLKL